MTRIKVISPRGLPGDKVAKEVESTPQVRRKILDGSLINIDKAFYVKAKSKDVPAPWCKSVMISSDPVLVSDCNLYNKLITNNLLERCEPPKPKKKKGEDK